MFDKIKFAQTLNTINDSYNTMTEFAEKSKVNRTYISQYINMKLDSPPTPKILEKLASASNNIVTYKDLMIMCGYLQDEVKNYVDLSEKLAQNKAYIDCYNLLISTTLSEAEIDKLLYYISTMDIEKKENDENNLKKMITSLFDTFPKKDRELVNIILTKYWKSVLKYREEAVKFLANSNYDKDEEEFKFAYHKEMEGLTDEEIADALRFYKEMKNKMKGNK